MPVKFDNTLLQYLHSKTVIDNGCLLWVLTRDKDGYGCISNRLTKQYGTTRVHRLMYIAHNGIIPQGLVVMHSCDNRACVNIMHLSIGTHCDNVLDKVKKGRQMRHTSHWNSKLSLDKVSFIRKTSGVFSAVLLADMFNINKRQVYRIRSGERW